ncbi:heterokaryon incompatibility protein [Sporormia fimetaria CBS 119925]|uniref:Heterokaryon incompatibility protein n=1 Tax=Sporormia fimetaria CBS 119925 TaxID=1340428 RepID=A0A6A6VP82_9PLEO|nr:heterokaryon incompatibility protein [Sporormia fimetaria CBS 119925]
MDDPHTYQYTPLRSDNHIRLLQVIPSKPSEDAQDQVYTYRLIETEVPALDAEEAPVMAFEAASYTWGSATRVGNLHMDGGRGTIALTQSLSEALPYLAKHSETGYLWLDQICIHQADPVEKAHQVAMMSRIYKSASRVLVWLGLKTEQDEICKEWLHEIEEMLKTMPNSHLTLHSSPTFNPSIRHLIVTSTFTNPSNPPHYPPAIHHFFTRPWFTRGWIVQEFLLARSVHLLTSSLTFTVEDLADMYTIPPSSRSGPTDTSLSYRILMNIKLEPFTEAQPLAWLRLITQATQEFETRELADSLFAFLGLLPADTGFMPDYSMSIRENFTRFAATLAERFGRLEFLSMWSANLDPLVPITPEELKGFPSWVPSFSWIPLSAPFRLAVGGVRSLGCEIRWNADKGRAHVHGGENEEAGKTGRLVVKGRVIDSLATVSTARFRRAFDVESEYLGSLVEQIRRDIPGLAEHWGVKDLLRFLLTVSYNGSEPRETVEQVLGETEGVFMELANKAAGYNNSWGLCLAMGVGRRFARTGKGRLALVPFIGSKADEEGKGSKIVVLHGCIVPMVLEGVEGSKDEWRVVGDCYVEGFMFGEGVEWDIDEAESFVLV